MNNNEYKLEKIWRTDKNAKNKDSKGMKFPYPNENNKWSGQCDFIERLKTVNDYLLTNPKHYDIYTEKLNCLLCDKKHVTTLRFRYNDVMWEDGLMHYIDKHNIEPTLSFKKFIYNKHIFKNINHSIKNTEDEDKIMKLELIKDKNKTYAMIDKKQLLILDALMIHGGYDKKYSIDDDDILRYSEHMGYLDFHETYLSKIIVSGKTEHIDDEDGDIFLPTDTDEIYAYEYIFHTHPPTPKAGGRAVDGILYEFPSISDIYHFIDCYNKGNIIGSLVVTSEGLYNIRRYMDENNKNKKSINVDEDRLYRSWNKTFDRIQTQAIEKYGTSFTKKHFYSVIAQDTKHIDSLNVLLNKYEIHIDYYPRRKDKKNRWILDTLFLVYDHKNKKIE
jgi:hypothetical protein